MNSNILINIPHSSIYLPTIFTEKLLIDKKYLEKEKDILTDIYTDDLFSNENCNILKCNFSRLFCDVERFRNDKYETMSKIGMGAIYTNTTKGDKLLNKDEEYNEFVLKNFYDKYHNHFNKLCENILSSYNKCIIIDAHSFSKELITSLKIPITKNIPDFCIGFEKEFCDYEIINIIETKIKKNNYSVTFNYPYSGSIVPNKYYISKDNRVKSIMIEINKKVYLNSNGDKSYNYYNVKKLIQEIIKCILYKQKLE